MNDLNWEGCDVVLECTGKFNDGPAGQGASGSGASRVLLSAQGKTVDRTVVYGVNDNEMPASDTMIFSNVLHDHVSPPAGQGTA